MVSKATIKLIKSLQQKKYRNKTNLFVVEGVKSVQEFINGSFNLEYLFYEESVSSLFNSGEIVNSTQLNQMSGLKNAQKVIAVFNQKRNNLKANSDLMIALDNLQDPGNLGTIIRSADWFGIQKIICNADTVDCFNPKVIQACMGSLNRVKVEYLDLKEYLRDYKGNVYGTFMNGENIYSSDLANEGIIVMGNEGNGISNEIADLCTHKITIPQSPNNNSTESLNVAIATSIIISEFSRNKLM